MISRAVADAHSGESRAPLPAIDRVLVAACVAFAATSLLFDRAAALDWVGPEVGDPFGRALYWYAAKYDPLVAQNPLWLRVMSGISAFVFGPFYFVLGWGIAKRRRWIRAPAIVYAAVMLYTMVVHVVVELWCDTPPPNIPVFLGTYLGYAVVPAVLLRRMLNGFPGGEA